MDDLKSCASTGRASGCESSLDSGAGLRGPAGFFTRLGRAIERSRQQPDCFSAVLILQVEQTPELAARRLKNCIRPADAIARVSEDAFAILLEEISSPSEAELIADRIQYEMAQPAWLDGREVSPGSSIGMALTTRGLLSPEAVLQEAGRAQQQAKALRQARRINHIASKNSPSQAGIV